MSKNIALVIRSIYRGAIFILMLLLVYPYSVFCQTDSLKFYKVAGSRNYESGNYPEAAYHFKKVSELYTASDNIYGSLDYENKAINSLKHFDKKIALIEGENLYQKLLEICFTNRISFGLWHSILQNIAEIRSLNDNNEGAINLLQMISDSLTIGHRIEKNKALFLNVKYDIAQAFAREGLHIVSIKTIEPLEEFLSDDGEKQRYFKIMADLYKSTGNSQKANQFFFKLINYVEENSVELAHHLNSIGNNYSNLGEYELAIQFYLKSLDLRLQLFEEMDPELGIIFHNLANKYKMIGKEEEAKDYYFKALKNYKLAYGVPSDNVGFVYNSLGNYYFDLMDFTKALFYYKEGLANREKVLAKSSPLVLHSYYNVANTYLMMEELDSAQSYIDLAKNFNPIGQEVGDNISVYKNVEYLKDYAFTYWVDGEIKREVFINDNNILSLEESSNSFSKSIESYYQLLKFQDMEESKLAYVEDLKTAIVGAINNQMSIDSLSGKKNFKYVFSLFEKSHNSQLLELLKNSNHANDSALSRENIIDIIDYRRELNRAKNADTSNYKFNIDKITKVSAELLKFQNMGAPAYERLLETETNILDFEKVANQLDKKCIILQFLVSPKTDQVFYFSISKNWSDYGFLCCYKDLDEACNDFNNSVRRFDIDKADIVSQRISEKLQKALPLNFEEYNRIIVIPDEFLWHVPFDAIPNPYSSKVLIEDYDITLHLSCNLLTLESLRSKDYYIDFVGFAPFVYSDDNNNYEMIPSSENEILNASYAISKMGRKSLHFIDTLANLDNFLEFAPSSSILHFATHFDFEKDGSLHGLLLRPKSKRSGMEFIGYNEIIISGSSPELVILSACNSAFELIDIKGEGPINLNRAFMLNGTQNIVYSIRRISDTFSEEFFELFYGFLSEGLNYYDCLNSTKRILMKNPQYAHPFYWSSFQMISKI